MSLKAVEIVFHSEDVDFELNEVSTLKDWIAATIQEEDKLPGPLNFIFCSDDYLHALNVEFLDHDTLTDIITFPLSDTEVSGDIFISIDRVRENASTYKVEFDEELSRVMIHGILHLCGYGDKTSEESNTMREKEDFYLAKKNDV